MSEETLATNQLLKYHGGKWRIAPWIISNMPAHEIYVEPFCGGGSVLLQKPRSRCDVYNDKDGEIVNFFKVVRDNGKELSEKIYFTPYSRIEYESAFELCNDPIENARRVLIRARMGFGGFSTHGLKVGFVSFGGDKRSVAGTWKNVPGDMAFAIERLRGVVIENRDWVEIVGQHDTPQTLFYFDPPYLPETRDKGKDYRHELTVKDHQKLGSVILEIKGSAVISGYDSPLYNEMFKSLKRVSTKTTSNQNTEREEVLWIKGKVDRQQDLF